jgi:phospholipid-translocating ATPase
VKASSQPYTVIVRGDTLEIALVDHKEKTAQLMMGATSAVCCRVTPKQKAELVKVVKDAGRMTLAIGDGGNDVSMIQEAHVGVGIKGKEGLQASRAADYVVAPFMSLQVSAGRDVHVVRWPFRCIVPVCAHPTSVTCCSPLCLPCFADGSQRLLLIHGRYSYYRTSLVAQYSFYKSFLFCFLQVLSSTSPSILHARCFPSRYPYRSCVPRPLPVSSCAPSSDWILIRLWVLRRVHVQLAVCRGVQRSAVRTRRVLLRGQGPE